MQLTKHVHSCVRLDDGERSLVIDPGGFSDLDSALDGASAVLITHEHTDHLDHDRVVAAAQADPRLRIWAPAAVAATLLELGDQVVTVGVDESFEAAGFAVQTFGGQHALIHPLIPIVANIGYLIDGTVFHPGDSFVVPPAPVNTLLLPANAPWSKISEIIDYAIAVRAPFSYPIHDFLVGDAYGTILQRNLVPIVERFGVDFRGWDEPVTA
jgi:glyoxylase-like metal-dependent hydrolase (beta-lactamase superfamily II)